MVKFQKRKVVVWLALEWSPCVRACTRLILWETSHTIVASKCVGERLCCSYSGAIWCIRHNLGVEAQDVIQAPGLQALLPPTPPHFAGWSHRSRWLTCYQPILFFVSETAIKPSYSPPPSPVIYKRFYSKLLTSAMLRTVKLKLAPVTLRQRLLADSECWPSLVLHDPVGW